MSFKAPLVIKHIKEQWVHLFVDGEVESQSENASAGGVICDQNSDWILGYTRYVSKCSPFETELWGILDEILILQNKRYRHFTIQTNNVEVARNLIDHPSEDAGITIL